MAIYNVNKTSSPTITQTATRSGGVMRVGGLNLSSLISALSGMSDNQKNRCDIIINDTYSLTQYDSTTYTNSSIQSNGSVISYILDTTTPAFKSRVGSTDTPINVTSWKIIYADDSISGGNSYPANRVSYDNTGTDLTATTVQGAITEIINGGTENIFDGSIEDWNALSTAEKTAYDHAMINNDYSDNPVGNLNALTTTDKSSAVAAINEVNGDVINLAAMISANPLSHNGIYTGRNLGTISSASDWAAFRAKYGIADKSYKGLYLGDYVKVNDGTYNADWMVAGFNTETNKGSTNIPGECVSMIPRLGDGCGSSYMNSTNVTTGGYKDSYMNTTKLPDVATKLTTIFGSNLVTRDILVSKTVTNGYASDWEWISCKCSLLTSVQVYGSLSFENTGGTYFAGYNIGEGWEKLPVFNFIHPVQFSRSNFWLRGVFSASNFCIVSGYGYAGGNGASSAFGVRPLICLS